MVDHSVRVCSRCVCDTTISSLRFNARGVCNLCESHDRMAACYPEGERAERALESLVARIKQEGKGRAYDCIAGVSGGTDSSFTLALTKRLGLRPLAVHFDNGWNTDQSVTNIKRLTQAFDVDLDTYVVDWEEFKDLQLAFLQASVPCIEAPTDVGIQGVLYRTAEREGLRTILGGHSFRTEGTVPREWSYLDGTYIATVHRKFGTKPTRSFPNLTMPRIAYYTFVKRMRNVPILNYLSYSKPMAKETLARDFGWVDYGGHHYENIYARFAFGWYEYKKFGIDKRKVSLSGPVRSGQMSRAQALETLQTPPPVEDEIVDYVVNKLGITRTRFDEFMAAPPKTYRDYFTSDSILRYMKAPMKLAIRMRFFTPVLYEKYFA